jgi:hypothetical protein
VSRHEKTQTQTANGRMDSKETQRGIEEGYESWYAQSSYD